jgi:hypothetical protein
MTNGSPVAERYPGTFLIGGTDEGARYTVTLDYVPVELGHLDDPVRG